MRQRNAQLLIKLHLSGEQICYTVTNEVGYGITNDDQKSSTSLNFRVLPTSSEIWSRAENKSPAFWRKPYESLRMKPPSMFGKQDHTALSDLDNQLGGARIGQQQQKGKKKKKSVELTFRAPPAQPID